MSLYIKILLNSYLELDIKYVSIDIKYSLFNIVFTQFNNCVIGDMVEYNKGNLHIQTWPITTFEGVM